MKTFKHDLVEVDQLVQINEAGKRHYETPNGNKYPSVTTVLNVLSKAAIQEWRNHIGEEKANKIMRSSSSRGTNAHKVIEKYIWNQENYLNGSMPDAIELFKEIQPILDEKVDNVRMIEGRLWSDELKVAGTVDLIAEWDGVLSSIDWKTSLKNVDEDHPKLLKYKLQGTAYAKLFEERTGINVPQVVIAIMVAGMNSMPSVQYSKAEEEKPKILIFKTTPSEWENRLRWLCETHK